MSYLTATNVKFDIYNLVNFYRTRIGFSIIELT